MTLRRSYLNRGTKPLARHTELRPDSKKRRKEAPARRDVREATWERQGGRCAAAGLLPGPCGGPADTHEMVARSAYPGGHLDLANTVGLCRLHHAYVTEHRAEAEAVGLRQPSWSRRVA